MYCGHHASGKSARPIHCVVNGTYELIFPSTNAYNYISGSYFLARVLGSAVGSLLLSDHVYVLNGLSISCYLLTICVATHVSPHCERDDSVGEIVEPLPEPSEEDSLIAESPSGRFDCSCSSHKVASPSSLARGRACSADRANSHTHSLNCCSIRGAPLTPPF